MFSHPAVILFDVNETLSDLTPMAGRFAETGAPDFLARVWFAGVLRDGFALAAAGSSEKFAFIATELLTGTLAGMPLNRPIGEAVEHIMGGFAGLSLHPDVVGGVRALKEAGLRLATLTNGSTHLAERLFSDAGIEDDFEHLISVEDGPGWKPLKGAYGYAAQVCEVQPAQMLLVAVHPWDIHGAARAGLATAWLNRSGIPYPRYFQAPDVTVSSLSGLTPLVMDL
ncbi:MAG: haloacid dehalogenase type II [Actinomycetota bacterium]|nr:haloacid dehalogenase type II [Actinomycetota bacterium]